MAGKGLDMKIIDEIKRLKSLGFTQRKIAKYLSVHRATVKRYWDVAEEGKPLDIPPTPIVVPHNFLSTEIEWEKVRAEALRGVPIKILYEELSARGFVSVHYASFWKQLQKRAPVKAATMVRIFTPGSRIEIDYADGIDILDMATGEIISTEFFAGVLANSRYTFAEFTLTQSSEDFLSSHVRMLEFFGGAPQVIAPDNLKSAVTRTHRYDSVINPAYTRLADHYGFAVVPARV